MFSKILFLAFLLSLSFVACKKEESATPIPEVVNDLITNKFNSEEQDIFKNVANKRYPGNENTFTVNDSTLILKYKLETFKITKLKGVYIWNELVKGVFKPNYNSSSISLNQLFGITNEAEIGNVNFKKFIEVLEKYNNRFINYTKLNLVTYMETESGNGQFYYTANGKTYNFKIEKQGTKFAVFLMTPTDFGLIANLDADFITLAKALKSKLPKEVVDNWVSTQGEGSFTEEEQNTFITKVREKNNYSSYYSFVFRVNKDSLMYKSYKTSGLNLGENTLVLKKNGILTNWYYNTTTKKYEIDNSSSSTTIFAAVNYYDPSTDVSDSEINVLKTAITNSFKTVVPANYNSEGDLFAPLIYIQFETQNESEYSKKKGPVEATNRYRIRITIASTSVITNQKFSWYADRNLLTPYANKEYFFTIEKINGLVKILAPEIGLLSASDFKNLLPAPIAKYIVAR